MIILGVDPGTATTGFGVIKNQDSKLSLIDYGCITTKADTPNPKRLSQIEQQLTELIKKHRPEQVAVEDLFFFKNVKTVIKVSQARGVVLAKAAGMDIPVYEYTPLQVKQAVASYGRAEKPQVQKMVKMLLCLDDIPKPDDAADALAVAICCANSIKINPGY